MRVDLNVWRESYSKWRQTGPLLAVEELRQQVIRATVMKEGVKAFLAPVDAETAKKLEIQKAQALELDKAKKLKEIQEKADKEKLQ